jgi:tRNA threonylcarbamoyladenosine biosynthesis protein TsaE
MGAMTEVANEDEMQAFGERLGRLFRGGEIVELIGDVGAGKTTLVRGIARGMGIDETVQSPSFTISRMYDATDGRRLAHYDFYRLKDPGIMARELAETTGEGDTVTVIEWADSIQNVLPTDRLKITIAATSEDKRTLNVESGGENSKKRAEQLQ